MRISLMDCEMSNLNANFGVIICGVFLINGQKRPIIYRIDQYPGFKKDVIDDRELLLAVKKEIEESDILVTYNGKRFDLPFLNSRLIFWKEQPLLPVKHIDLYPIIRWQYKLSDSKLKTAAKFLLPEETQKTEIDGMHWVRFTMNKKSRDYIVHHCVKDVQVLKGIFDLVKGSIRWIK